MRNGVVHLAVAIAAAAHQRQHLAGVRIERDQRHLRIGDGAGFLVARVELLHLLVDHVNG